jgi:hypothetical protein
MLYNLSTKTSVFIIVVAIIGFGILISEPSFLNEKQENVVLDYIDNQIDSDISDESKSGYEILKRNNKTFDGKFTYSSVIRGNIIEIDKRPYLPGVSEKVVEIEMPEIVDSIEIVDNRDNTLVLLARSRTELERQKTDALDTQWIERVLFYDLNNQEIDEVYKESTYGGNFTSYITSNSKDIYFSRGSFEGLSSFLILNIASGRLQNISAKTGLYITSRPYASPNERYIALSTAGIENDVYTNRLSLYDTYNNSFIHTKLITEAKGTSYQDMDGFEMIYWDDSSEKVYAQVRSEHVVTLDGEVLK